MKLLLLSRCTLLLLCWVAALSAALLCSASLGVVRTWGICRRIVRARRARLRKAPA